MRLGGQLTTMLPSACGMHGRGMHRLDLSPRADVLICSGIELFSSCTSVIKEKTVNTNSYGECWNRGESAQLPSLWFCSTHSGLKAGHSQVQGCYFRLRKEENGFKRLISGSWEMDFPSGMHVSRTSSSSSVPPSYP